MREILAMVVVVVGVKVHLNVVVTTILKVVHLESSDIEVVMLVVV